MNPDTKRAHAKAETRATLLSVARLLFQTRGYEAVGVREIADEAGLSTGAIFNNWPGKDALFAEAMGRPHLTDDRAAILLRHVQQTSPHFAAELLEQWAA